MGEGGEAEVVVPWNPRLEELQRGDQDLKDQLDERRWFVTSRCLASIRCILKEDSVRELGRRAPKH